MRAALLPSSRHARRRSFAFLLVTVTALTVSGLVAVPAASATAAQHDPITVQTKALWDQVTRKAANAFQGEGDELELDRFRAFELNREGIADALELAPLELTRAADRSPLVLSIPAPAGGFQRFEVWESPIMEPELAALHPDIHTYAGRGITDPAATIRFDLTPLGFHASVRGQQGSWYIDPYSHLDQGLYASYFRSDLENIHGPLEEHGLQEVEHVAAEMLDGFSSQERAAMLASTGPQLRTYRLALVSDPPYATYSGGPANVTSAKVTLLNRVTQIYESETAIRMILIGNNNLLNLDTVALATGANGPCGGAACYTTAQLSDCTDDLLARNRIVVGQIIGASNYDIGHIMLGGGGGGLAGPGPGGDTKARGCTGHAAPKGDAFAVDYVVHEMGHQFTANHTFNGNQDNCAGNHVPATAVEPGSGSSIMAYAGICASDNLQQNSDPYFSQKSYDQITTYISSAQPPINEVQNVSLRNFDGTDSFRLTFNAMTSAPIVRGTNYTFPGIQAALTSIGAAGTSVQGFGGSATLDDTGFQVTFGGATNVGSLGLAGETGMTGFVGETAKGGPIDNGGSQVTATGNSAPAVTVPGPVTIPYRTPFSLSGSATDADGDALTYMWEQNNAGAAPVQLNDVNKTNGPLFRQFGTALDASKYVGTTYNADGENHPTANGTRVFPDMAQILANNTNADSGTCPAAPANQVDCFSEFLPTPVYPGPMNFRLTARDNSPGGGGVNSADTVVNLGPGSGPFRITSHNAAATYAALSTQTVTWDVALSNLPPIGTTNVEILLSTDGGATFPHVLAATTANDGSQSVTLPDVDTTQGRIMVRALGNIFFDVSNANVTIERRSDMELVSKTDSQDPAFAGESLTYTITARNNGPSPADNAKVVDVLPSQVAYASSSIPCTESPTGTLTCNLGAMADDESKTFTITVSIPRDLVHNTGAPLTITNTATADSERVDPDPSNDSKSEDTLVKAKADLEILSFEAVNPPSEMIIGEPATVTLRKHITNNGPSAPMDVRVSRTASSTPNATVSPTATSHEEEALGYQEDRTVDEEFEIECNAPGPATFTFDNAISPDRPDDTDPDTSNNTAQESFTLDCIVPVAVNIKPGSFRNPINRNAKGEIPLAVLTTAAGEYGLPLAFDATTIHPTTARFGPEVIVIAGGGAREGHGRGHIEDAIERSDEVTRDGDLDMVLHFKTQESQLNGAGTKLCVRGRFGPTNFIFHGCDIVDYVQ
jgi:uncharacterized repeat protein (TIGR01451 family)